MITQTLINPHQLLGFVPQGVLCLTNNFHIFFLPYYSCPVNHDSSETNSNIVMTSQYGKKKTKTLRVKETSSHSNIQRCSASMRL